jgi:hypothetical protein
MNDINVIGSGITQTGYTNAELEEYTHEQIGGLDLSITWQVEPIAVTGAFHGPIEVSI